MALTKLQKEKVIEDLKEKIAEQKSIVFVDFSGLNSKETFDLRDKLKKAGCLLKIAKKTLLRVALEKCKIPIWREVHKNIPGQLALVFGFKEGYESSKITYEFSKENKNLKILGGFLENNFKQVEEVIILAQLPTRPELLGSLIRSVTAPVSNFTNVLRGNLQNLVYLLSEIKK